MNQLELGKKLTAAMTERSTATKLKMMMYVRICDHSSVDACTPIINKFSFLLVSFITTTERMSMATGKR